MYRTRFFFFFLVDRHKWNSVCWKCQYRSIGANIECHEKQQEVVHLARGRMTGKSALQTMNFVSGPANFSVQIPLSRKNTGDCTEKLTKYCKNFWDWWMDRFNKKKITYLRLLQKWRLPIFLWWIGILTELVFKNLDSPEFPELSKHPVNRLNLTNFKQTQTIKPFSEVDIEAFHLPI